ncbi:MAG: hypothetical protein ACK5L5_04025, partial [Bacteroidales bacterium]
MKNLILIPLLVASFITCKENEESAPEIPITSWENKISIRVQDSSGKDLLNRQNEGHYRTSDITISGNNDINAVSVSKYPPEADFYHLSLLLNYPKPDIETGKQYDEIVKTLVSFGGTVPDTITGSFEVMYHDGVDKHGYGISNGYSVILQEANFNSK